LSLNGNDSGCEGDEGGGRGGDSGCEVSNWCIRGLCSWLSQASRSGLSSSFTSYVFLRWVATQDIRIQSRQLNTKKNTRIVLPSLHISSTKNNNNIVEKGEDEHRHGILRWFLPTFSCKCFDHDDHLSRQDTKYYVQESCDNDDDDYDDDDDDFGDNDCNFDDDDDSDVNNDDDDDDDDDDVSMRDFHETYFLSRKKNFHHSNIMNSQKHQPSSSFKNTISDVNQNISIVIDSLGRDYHHGFNENDLDKLKNAIVVSAKDKSKISNVDLLNFLRALSGVCNN